MTNTMSRCANGGAANWTNENETKHRQRREAELNAGENEELTALQAKHDEVVAELEKAGKTAEGYVLYTYAAIQAWADAVNKAGSTDFDPVVTALNDGDYTTVIGDLSFDDKGDVTLPGYVVYEWKDGQFIHPHDACFAANGDIYVAEWVGTGRITKLERV